MTPQRPILKEENTHKELDVNEKSKVFIKTLSIWDSTRQSRKHLFLILSVSPGASL